jgi:hypothetical protein
VKSLILRLLYDDSSNGLDGWSEADDSSLGACQPCIASVKIDPTSKVVSLAEQRVRRCA